MSPDSIAIQWLMIICTLFQTAIAIAQVASRPHGDSSHGGAGLDYAMRVSILAAVVGFGLFLTAPSVRDLGVDESAATTTERVGIILAIGAMIIAPHSIGVNIREVFTDGVGVGRGFLYALAAITGVGILIGAISLPFAQDYNWVMGLMVVLGLGTGLFYDS